MGGINSISFRSLYVKYIKQVNKMKRIHNILLGVVAFAAVGCIDEVNNSDVTSVKTGDDVQFGLTLPGMTRTIYGEKSPNAYPIYWVDGDKVQIYSPQCHSGRNNAEYKVAVNGPEQNYATSLIPTGENGVQWGVDETADFYSVYPSGDTYAIGYKPKGYEEGKESVLTIENLKINFLDKFEVSSNGVVEPMGSDCLMIAKAENVKKGDFVNLKYSPIATSVIITLQGPTSESAVTEHTIQSVKLIAPEGTDIAGTFNVQWDNEKYSFAKWSSDSEKSNEITAQLMVKGTNQFYTIKQGETLAVPLFLVPTDLTIDGNWKVQVVTTTQTFTKKLSMVDEGELTPGMVHELPALPALDVKTESEWEEENWMTNIPKNVYLSEISIPGSWNSLNKDAQGTNPTISGQYQNGVRAFHLDTRWKRSGSYGSYKYELGVADGGSTANVGGEKVMTDSANPTFVSCLSSITGELKENEYMILFCTFAQDSYHANPDNKDWVHSISAACSANEDVYDAKNLTQNTLVGDVLGKLIVVINTGEYTGSYPTDSKCLFVNLPMTMTESDFSGLLEDRAGDAETVKGNSCITMYQTHAQASIRQDNIPYSGSGDRTATDRGFLPTRGERKREITNMLDWSMNNYNKEDYGHDKWIYIGLGGYYVSYSSGVIGIGAGWKEISDPNSTVASDFNAWINERITAMGHDGVPFYPVGIVLMNYVNDYKDTVKNILMLNNKYPLRYDSNKPADYKPGN